MSLVTQCPACGTTFKVVRDQLRISEGWVRCGQCTEVFDTAPNLRELALDEAPLPGPAAGWVEPEAGPFQGQAVRSPDGHAVQAEPEPEPELAPGAESEREPEPEPFAAALADDPPPLPAVAPQVSEPSHQDLAEPDALPVEAALAADLAEPLPDPLAGVAAGLPDEPVPTAAQAMAAFYEPHDVPLAPLPASVAAEAPEATPVPVAPALSEPAEAQNFSFIQQARPPSAWHRPWARAVLGLVGLLLVGLLALQVVVQERDRLAASHPDARRLLLSLCGLLHCQIQPWRQIEAVAVDASGFNKLRGDAYRLSFVVKNMARVELARPAIELTLTDTQDQPLLRRVLLPGELNPPAATMAAGEEWSGAYLVSLAPPPGGASLAKSVAGYRLLAFYP